MLFSRFSAGENQSLQEAAPHSVGTADTWGPPGRARSTLNLQNAFNVTSNTKVFNFS